jgi:hypothetical protein
MRRKSQRTSLLPATDKMRNRRWEKSALSNPTSCSHKTSSAGSGLQSSAAMPTPACFIAAAKIP